MAGTASADPFYGANVNGVWGFVAAKQQILLDSLSAAGLKLARFDVDWNAVEPQPGVFDWAETDLQITELEQAGMEPYPILHQTPSWDRVDDGLPPGIPNSVPSWSVAPVDPEPFAAFVAAFAERYGVGGSFSTAVSDPVHDYEIWNEEDDSQSYYPVDPVGYAALYVDARRALKAVDPSGTVVMGGLAAVWYSNEPHFNVDSYARTAITAIGYCPDSIGYHAYPLTTRGLFSSLADFRASLDQLGCVRTPIELNEYDYVGSGNAAASVGATAAELPDAHLGVDRMMPLPAVPSQDVSVPSSLATLVDETGRLTAVGQAYSAVVLGDPAPVLTWPAPQSRGAAPLGTSTSFTTSSPTPPAATIPSPVAATPRAAQPPSGPAAPGTATGEGAIGEGARPAGCPADNGKLTRQTLGRLRLGMTTSQADKLYTHHSFRGRRYEEFFCLTPIGVRVGYPSPKLLFAVPPRERVQLARTIIWASTSSPFYTLDGIRPGATLATAGKRLRLSAPFRIGLNYWYVAPDTTSTAVLKVRHGIVEEIGIADQRLTGNRRSQRIFLTSFS
jgi:hypothetical protein